MSKIINATLKNNDLYGPYDCITNAILFFLRINNFSPEVLFRFNWDIQFSVERDRITGSASEDYIFPLLEKKFGITGIKIPIVQIPITGFFFIILDLYDLPFSNVYQSRHQEHCVVSRRTSSDQFEVISPYFKSKTLLSSEQLYLSWKRYADETIFKVDVNPALSEKYLSNCSISPFITSVDYVERYNHAFEFTEYLSRIVKTYENKLDFFNKYLGMLFSIYNARERYFDVFNDEGMYKEKILGGWRNVQKELLKLESNLSGNISDSLSRVLETECSYIDFLISNQNN